MQAMKYVSKETTLILKLMVIITKSSKQGISDTTKGLINVLQFFL